MEPVVEYLQTCWERLQNPELLFGLMVRFFGVFIVLTIVMFGIWVAGKTIAQLEEFVRKRAEPPQGDRSPPKGPPAQTPGGASPGQQPGAVPEEVAVVIALALSGAEHSPMGHPAAGLGTPSSWKLLGRQDALSRNVP